MSDDFGQTARLGKHGGSRIKGEQNADRRLSGVRRSYILARLERDNRHDLAAAIRDGRLSAYTVAVELGWTKRPEVLGTGSTNAARRRRHQLAIADGALSPDQLQELWLGPSSAGSTFDSPEHVREAWAENRDQVMQLWAKNGRRPQSWWVFDAPALGLAWPGYERQQSYLFEAGALSETERGELLAFWRKEFARPFSSVPERRSRHRWADIPQSLLKEWRSQRRRKTRKPDKEAIPVETTASEPAA
jgi:hypothetical protein